MQMVRNTQEPLAKQRRANLDDLNFFGYNNLKCAIIKRMAKEKTGTSCERGCGHDKKYDRIWPL